MTVGQIAEIKDKLVENDKKLAEEVNDINEKIESGELKGDKGDKGDAGKSAYESAVAGGYTGTEAQFNKDLATDENTYVDNETTVSATENKDGTVTIKAEQKEHNFDGKDITTMIKVLQKLQLPVQIM